MATNNHRLQFLFEKYFNKTASAEESVELAGLIKTLKDDEELSELLNKAWISREDEKPVISPGTATRILNDILGKREVPVHKIRWWRISAAASIILLLGLGSYFIYFNKSKQKDAIVKTTPAEIAAPDKTKATITLANGQKVLLDSLTSGVLIIQDNVQVIKKTSGEIVYQTKVDLSENLQNPKYNELFNPRGSKVVNLTLQDGTKVWLNSESSLKYPVVFTGNERKVEITGEAYFEVRKDAGRKFLVNANGSITEVLGTHFNVNSYADEDNVKITLLEGSVIVSRESGVGSRESATIKPGQQAQVGKNHSNFEQVIKVLKGVNLDAVMAWKNGYFQFTGSNTQAVMRQIARWYDVEVVYEGQLPERKFAGQMERASNLSKVLRVLEESNVHFKIEGKRVTVRP